MDPVTQELRDPTWTESLEETAALCSGAHVRSMGEATTYVGQPGVPTIDLDLPPVDAAPKSKGPRWRLGELRASIRRLEAMVPNERERVRRRAQQWLGDL